MSKINDHAQHVAEEEGKKLRDRMRIAYGFANVRAIARGVPELEAMNDAIGIMCALASTAILATMDQLMQLQPGLDPKRAFDIIMHSVAENTIRATNSAIEAMTAKMAADDAINGVANDG